MKISIDKAAELNQKGLALEKSNNIDKAIQVYEELVSKDVDTPHTYKRLAIIYGKRKDDENAIRVVKSALKNTSNPTHVKWFKDRLRKLDG